MISIPGLTNSGSMPINAGAGPSSVGGNEEVNFRGGNVSFGAGMPSWFLMLMAAGLVWLLLKGK
ncbi:hypothetical protein [Photobacterium sp. GSS17]|uniref:hypothetical protein n=1 Tax=Photobacterium TaxID=657 RepID=UPI00235F4771|nr:hypothetical protein [Photobacterium sp. GSS17]